MLATAGTWDEWRAEGDPQLEQVKLAYRCGYTGAELELHTSL